MNKEKI